MALLAELSTRTYRPAPSACFVTTRPKLREIFAADFRDRVVHHLLVGELECDWERVFIHDSYACRRGKGVHKAVDRLQRFLLQASANGTRPAWYLQLDVHNYFMALDKDVLWAALARRLHDPAVAWLTHLLVYHDCTQDYVYKGKPGLLARVPPHKSLLRCPPGKGLPIGNLNSQFFANVYLNALDQYVKHGLKCRWYLRYCDDFVLVARDREQLLAWRDTIEAFLAERLLLALNARRERLRPLADGVDFLGYIVRPHYRLARRRVVNRMHERLAAFERAMVAVSVGDMASPGRTGPARTAAGAAGADSAASAAMPAPMKTAVARPVQQPPGRFDREHLEALFVLYGGRSPCPTLRPPVPARRDNTAGVTRPGRVLRLSLDPGQVADLQATLASYLGHLRWADTRRLTAGLSRRYAFLEQHFRIDPTARRLRRRLPARCPSRRVRAQYAWWRRQLPDDVLFLQVGCYFELYQGRDRPLAEALGLQPMGANRRGARWGFPVGLLPAYLEAALAAGRAVTVVTQETALGGAARRRPAARYLPRPPAAP